MVVNEKSKRKIIPIGGGKGGVGKTLLAANLAIGLASCGKRTVVVDLDLGASNLHTALGLRNTRAGIGNFLSGKGAKFKSIVSHTPFENLMFVPGDVLVSGMSSIQSSQRSRLIRSILELEADYVILDLGSGSSAQVLDFFLTANSGCIVTTPAATSVVNAYGFLKNLAFRFMQRTFASDGDIAGVIKKYMKEKKPGSGPTMNELLGSIRRKDRASAQRAKRYLSMLRPLLIVNMASSPEDLKVADKLRELVSESLSVQMECLGLVYREGVVEESTEESKPLMSAHPDTLAAVEISRMCQKIVQSEHFPLMPLELDLYEDSFGLARIEAHYDYEQLTQKGGPDELFDAGDLLEIIAGQKRQIHELQGTLRNLTIKGTGGPF